MKKFRIANAIAYIAAGSVVLAALTFMYILLAPVDVLQNWSLKTDKNEYRTGETLIVTSKFDKVRDVSGTAKRYIECKTRNGSTNRIAIGEKEANRRSQVNGSNQIYLGVPSDIIDTPTTCVIDIVVEYRIYRFRDHTEHTKTPEFKVTKAEQAQEENVVTQDNDNQVVENSPVKGKSNARSAPLPETITDTPSVTEPSPVVPPNTSIVCRIPIVTTLLIKPLLGVC